MKSVRIVGAGFSGLVTAYFLLKRGLSIEVYEAQHRPGGMLETQKTPWGPVESAANGLLGSESLALLAQDIGLELKKTRPESRKRFLWYQDRPRRWPLSFWESLKTFWTFLKAGWIAGGRAPCSEETLSHWGERVFGKVFTERVLSVAIQGIYAAEAERLSASLIVGRFFQKHRKKNRSGLRGTVAPEEGMGAFTLKLRNWLVSQGVTFHMDQTVTPEMLVEWQTSPHCGAVVSALSVPQAAELTQKAFPRVAQLLREVETIPLSTGTVFFPETVPQWPGFGCLFPRSSQFTVLGVLFNNYIYEGRATPGVYAETWICPGSEGSEASWLSRVLEERSRMHGATAHPQPLGFRLVRWPAALPLYSVAHERRLKILSRELEQNPSLYLIGNYMGDLGLTRILERAQSLAAQVVEHVNHLERA